MHKCVNSARRLGERQAMSVQRQHTCREARWCHRSQIEVNLRCGSGKANVLFWWVFIASKIARQSSDDISQGMYIVCIYYIYMYIKQEMDGNRTFSSISGSSCCHTSCIHRNLSNLLYHDCGRTTRQLTWLHSSTALSPGRTRCSKPRGP